MTDRPLRVLVVSSKYMPEYAGSGLRAHRTYLRLRERFGVEFEVLAGSVTATRRRSYSLDGIPVTVLPGTVSAGGGLPGRLRRQLVYWRVAMPVFWRLARRSFDLLHVFGKAPVPSAAVTYAKARHRPLVMELVNTTRDPDQAEPRLLSALFGRGYPANALIVCLSEPIRERCIESGYEPGQLWTRPNPVDSERFFYEREARDRYRAQVSGFTPDDTLLVYVAKFMPGKQQLFALRVLKRLPDRFKLMLVGPREMAGPDADVDRCYFQQVCDFMRDAGLADRVELVPRFVDSPDTYMKAGDIFVMPSQAEAFGTPFAEALACGLPVVANDLRGVYGRWIRDGENGFLCPLDEAAWAEKVILAERIDDASRRKASKSILRETSTEVMDRAYYERLLAVARERPMPTDAHADAQEGS